MTTRKRKEKNEINEDGELTQTDGPIKIRKIDNEVCVTVTKLTWSDFRLDESKQSTQDLKTGVIYIFFLCVFVDFKL
jgi:hypothetical protein